MGESGTSASSKTTLDLNKADLTNHDFQSNNNNYIPRRRSHALQFSKDLPGITQGKLLTPTLAEINFQVNKASNRLMMDSAERDRQTNGTAPSWAILQGQKRRPNIERQLPAYPGGPNPKSYPKEQPKEKDPDTNDNLKNKKGKGFLSSILHSSDSSDPEPKKPQLTEKSTKELAEAQSSTETTPVSHASTHKTKSNLHQPPASTHTQSTIKDDTSSVNKNKKGFFARMFSRASSDEAQPINAEPSQKYAAVPEMSQKSSHIPTNNPSHQHQKTPSNHPSSKHYSHAQPSVSLTQETESHIKPEEDLPAAGEKKKKSKSKGLFSCFKSGSTDSAPDPKKPEPVSSKKTVEPPADSFRSIHSQSLGSDPDIGKPEPSIKTLHRNPHKMGEIPNEHQSFMHSMDKVSTPTVIHPPAKSHHIPSRVPPSSSHHKVEFASKPHIQPISPLESRHPPRVIKSKHKDNNSVSSGSVSSGTSSTSSVPTTHTRNHHVSSSTQRHKVKDGESIKGSGKSSVTNGSGHGGGGKKDSSNRQSSTNSQGREKKDYANSEGSKHSRSAAPSGSGRSDKGDGGEKEDYGDGGDQNNYGDGGDQNNYGNGGDQNNYGDDGGDQNNYGDGGDQNNSGDGGDQNNSGDGGDRKKRKSEESFSSSSEEKLSSEKESDDEKTKKKSPASSAGTKHTQTSKHSVHSRAATNPPPPGSISHGTPFPGIPIFDRKQQDGRNFNVTQEYIMGSYDPNLTEGWDGKKKSLDSQGTKKSQGSRLRRTSRIDISINDKYKGGSTIRIGGGGGHNLEDDDVDDAGSKNKSGASRSHGREKVFSDHPSNVNVFIRKNEPDDDDEFDGYGEGDDTEWDPDGARRMTYNTGDGNGNDKGNGYGNDGGNGYGNDYDNNGNYNDGPQYPPQNCCPPCPCPCPLPMPMPIPFPIPIQTPAPPPCCPPCCCCSKKKKKKKPPPDDQKEWNLITMYGMYTLFQQMYTNWQTQMQDQFERNRPPPPPPQQQYGLAFVNPMQMAMQNCNGNGMGLLRNIFGPPCPGPLGTQEPNPVFEVTGMEVRGNEYC